MSDETNPETSKTEPAAPTPEPAPPAESPSVPSPGDGEGKGEVEAVEQPPPSESLSQELSPPAPPEVSNQPAEPSVPTEAPPLSPIPLPSAPLESTQFPSPDEGREGSSLAEKFVENMRRWKEGLAVANARRREQPFERMKKILKAAATTGTITNYQVQKMFRCTRLTAWRYLRALEKAGKLRRTGGHNIPTYELVR